MVKITHIDPKKTALLTDGCAAFKQEVHDATLISLGSLGDQMTCDDTIVLLEANECP